MFDDGDQQVRHDRVRRQTNTCNQSTQIRKLRGKKKQNGNQEKERERKTSTHRTIARVVLEEGNHDFGGLVHVREEAVREDLRVPVEHVRCRRLLLELRCLDAEALRTVSRTTTL